MSSPQDTTNQVVEPSEVQTNDWIAKILDRANKAQQKLDEAIKNQDLEGLERLKKGIEEGRKKTEKLNESIEEGRKKTEELQESLERTKKREEMKQKLREGNVPEKIGIALANTWERYLKANPDLGKLTTTPKFKYVLPKQGDLTEEDRKERMIYCEGTTIHLPIVEGEDPTDALAAYIFESGNAKNEAEFSKIKQTFSETTLSTAKVTDPASNLEFGRQKIEAESKSVMEEFTAFAKLRMGGVDDLPHQANRNIVDVTLTIAGTLKMENLSEDDKNLIDEDVRKLMEAQKTNSESFDEFKKDKTGLKKWLDDHPKLLSLCLKSMESKEAQEAIKERTATTRHKNDAEPDDPRKLTSRDLYAFEMIGDQPGSVGNAMAKQLGFDPKNFSNPTFTTFKGSLTPLLKDEKLKPAVEALVMLTSMAMEEHLGEDAPDCVQFTEEMKEVARARLAKVKKTAPKGFKDHIVTHYGKHKKNLITMLNNQQGLKEQASLFERTLDPLLDEPGGLNEVAKQFEKMIEKQEEPVKKKLRITWSLLEGLVRAL
jgi:hypothetical protein